VLSGQSQRAGDDPDPHIAGENEEQVAFGAVLQHFPQSVGDMIRAGFFTVQFGDRARHVKGSKRNAVRDLLARLEEAPGDFWPLNRPSLQLPEFDEKPQNVDRLGDLPHPSWQRFGDRVSPEIAPARFVRQGKEMRPRLGLTAGGRGVPMQPVQGLRWTRTTHSCAQDHHRRNEWTSMHTLETRSRILIASRSET
jgi:hypothetical protein